MHERFVIAVLVDRVELQMAVEMKLKAPPVLSQHDPLIGRRFGVHDRLAQHTLFGQTRQAVGFDDADDQQSDHQTGAAPQTAQATRRQQRPQQIRPPQADGRVQQSAEQRRPHQAEPRHAEHRKQQRGEQRSEIIERQHARDEILEIEMVLQQPHQQRQFESDERPDGEHDAVQHDSKRTDR